MSTKSKLAIAAVLTLFAVPAFAGDQDSAALDVSSGRYLPDVQVHAGTAFTGAYAATVHPGKVRINPPQNISIENDFQLQGR